MASAHAVTSGSTTLATLQNGIISKALWTFFARKMIFLKVLFAVIAKLAQ
jgi:hypothetical protein